MKKKSIAARLGILAAALTLVTTSLMSGTLAKYTFQETLTGTAVIASWNPSATITNGGGATLEANFNLRDLMTGVSNKVLASGVIAPGSKGQINIKLDTNGALPPQVGATYTVFIKDVSDGENTAPPQIKFSDKAAMTNAYVPAKNTPKKLVSGVIEAGSTVEGAARPSVDVFWKWDFEAASDTAAANAADGFLGNAGATFKYQIIVELNQIDPFASSSSGS